MGAHKRRILASLTKACTRYESASESSLVSTIEESRPDSEQLTHLITKLAADSRRKKYASPNIEDEMFAEPDPIHDADDYEESEK